MACYVPFCESALPTKKGVKREPGVSFHQFPANEELRKKWIIAIGRKDPKTGAHWDPHSSAVVCSLHFSPKQFNGFSKHLKHGSIPFIFPDYYLPQRGSLINQNDLSSLKLIPFPNNINSENTSEQDKSRRNRSSNVPQTSNTIRASKTKRTFSKMNSSQTTHDQTENKQHNSDAPKFKFRIVLAKKSQILALSQPHSTGKLTFNAPPIIDLVTENSSSPETITSSLETNLGSSNESTLDTNTGTPQIKNSIQNTIEKLKKTNNSLLIKLNSEKNKNQMLEDENFKLQEENQSLKLENRIMEQKLEIFNTEELKKGITNSDAKAMFLFDQLCSLSKEECTWSQSTINFLNYIEEHFPACYNFLRQADIITLPAIKSATNLEICID